MRGSAPAAASGGDRLIASAPLDAQGGLVAGRPQRRERQFYLPSWMENHKRKVRLAPRIRENPRSGKFQDTGSYGAKGGQ